MILFTRIYGIHYDVAMSGIVGIIMLCIKEIIIGPEEGL
jgi:hypothetical protein